MQPRIIPRSDHPISRKNIDPDALKVLYRLYRSGHTAFLVGGGVRDLLIGRNPKDFDVCTSARPGQVKKLFRNCWLIGRRFRLAHIHFRDHKIVEVSTFRAQPEREDDGEEDLLVRQDNTFGTPEEDALRRDFTINGLFYDIASFSLIDYVGGVEDIEAGVIRTIGDPHIRFQEDPVRMIRAIKFAARLDFAIEPETWEALCEHVEDITKCSTSRVVEEIARLLEGGAACRSLQLLKASGLLRIVLPDLYEYIYGLPAGPGLALEGRAEVREVAEAMEEDLLLNADEDVDHEAQERILGVDGEEAPDDDEPLVDEGELDESSESDEGAVEEDEIDLSGDDESADVEVVTPQGTRCVQAPDRGGLLWRMLSAVDERVRTGHPLTRPALYAALFYPLVRHTADWMVGQTGRDDESVFMSLLRPLTATIVVSRRDRERVCQILAAQRKFKRSNRGFAQALSRKPYFAEALDLFEVYVLATGEAHDALSWWRERHPYVAPAVTAGRARPLAAVEGEGDDRPARRSRRRRRGGRGEGERDRDVDLRNDDDRPRRRESREYESEMPRRSSREVERGRGRRDEERPDREVERGRGRRDEERPPRVVERGRGRRDEERPSRDIERGRRRGVEELEHGRRRGGDDFDRGRYDYPEDRDSGRGFRRRPVDDYDEPPRRRDVRDIERDDERRRSARDLDREWREPSRSRSSGRDLPIREVRDVRNGSGRSRSRGLYREEGYRGPRRSADAMEYYESRVGHDLTPESPRPRRDDERRRGRRRRRKPPTINR
jgi:poly(A) polymerase